MSRLLIINPNTNDEMTDAIRATVSTLLRAGAEADVVKADSGFITLESFYEYSISTFGVLSTLSKLDLQSYDGVLLACFGDPGLYALKEILPVPVVGIAEASISMSLLLGSSFAIIAASDKAIPMMENMVAQYQLNSRCAGVFSLGSNVLNLEQDEEATVQLLLNSGKRAAEHGAEVLLLGCAGMTGYSQRIEKDLSVVVIDPIVAGFKMLEAIVDSGLTISRRGLYQTPSGKTPEEIDFLKPFIPGN